MCWFYGNNTFPFTQGDYDQTSLKSCYTLHGPGLQICSSHRIWLVIVVKTTQIRTLLTQVSCSAAPLLLTVPNMLFVSLAATTTLAQDGKSCHTLHHLESGVQLFREKKRIKSQKKKMRLHVLSRMSFKQFWSIHPKTCHLATIFAYPR